MRNSKSWIVVFHGFSNDIDVFVKCSKNWHFPDLFIDGPVQCYPEKAILIKKTFQTRCFG